VAETNPECFTAEVDAELHPTNADDSPSRHRPPPPQYPASEAPGPSAFRPPPSFSSLFPAQDHEASESVLEPCEPYKAAVSDSSEAAVASASALAAAPAYAPADDDQVAAAPESSNSASAALRLQDETKRALPRDSKAPGSSKDEEAEPPPAYSEGSSPLHTFTYLMAAAGGAASIITQVQQGGPSLNPLGGKALRCQGESRE
jgi:G patch domain-containing protein 1